MALQERTLGGLLLIGVTNGIAHRVRSYNST
jgi:hypothetical protein